MSRVSGVSRIAASPLVSHWRRRSRWLRPWWWSAVAVAAVVAVAAGLARTEDAATPAGGVTADRSVETSVVGRGRSNSLVTRTGHWVRFDASGARDATWPEVNGTRTAEGGRPLGVQAVVPDGSGGWFIGGDFSHVAGQRRAGLAHVAADGALDPAWAPAANGIVNALCVVDDTVYIGGYFAAIDGQPRKNLAAVDAVSGRVRAWAPRANRGVSALAAASGKLYVGGDFTRVGSTRRKSLAAFDAATGALTAWDPGVSGRLYAGFEQQVEALLVARGRLYVAGAFTRVAGRGRDSTAAFDAATGALTPWKPRGPSPALALAAASDTVYVGGAAGVGAVDARTGRVERWWADASDPDMGYVLTLTVVGDRLYVGGTFTSLGRRRRKNLGVVSARSGKPSAWNPRPDDRVFSLVAAGDGVLVGGEFTRLHTR